MITTRSLRHIAALALFAAAGTSLIGCGPQHDGTLKPGGQTSGAPNIDAPWPFWPVSMNIHPLTRWTTDRKTGRLLLEARIEFLDAGGDRSKAIGSMTLRLVEAGSPEDETETGIHYTQDLFEPNVNRLHFDQVTRTYVMKLEIEDVNELPAQPELRVEFQSMNAVEMRVAKRLDLPDSSGG